MLMTLIQKEMMHHILSARFVALLLMCVLLIPLNLHINYHHYLKRQIDYQEQEILKDEDALEDENDKESAGTKHSFSFTAKGSTDPNFEVSKLILKPTPLSVFATGLESALPSYLGMTRNGITRGEASLSTAPIAFLLGHLDFVFVVSTVFSLLALLFTFDAVAGEREAGTLRITLANALPRDIFLWSKLIGGYLVFILPFLISVIIGLLVLVLQGFPLSESDTFLRILCLIFVSLLYIFLATDATQTGQAKKNTYFQTGTRYYETLDTEIFSKMSEDPGDFSHRGEIPPPMPPPPLAELTLGETLQHAALDLLLLCFFAIVLTTVAFLKFFRMDI
ncbi:MAG: ABC transporter permease subunit [Candidatus Poribacteria bacterium]|nr:ABC transporter permease subunit [Candidatus Poribacteria bacterium]